MTNPLQNALIWVLIDDQAGNKSQAMGVVEALGAPFEVKSMAYTNTARLPNAVLGASFKVIDADSRAGLTAPWPDLVIAAGRRTAPVARHIKKLSGGHTKLVQIMYPGARGEDDFTLIGVPRHDQRSPAPNRFEMTGAPHRVTEAVLDDARQVWAGKFDHLPKPHMALIVGGSTKRKTFTPDMAKDLGQKAAALANEAGGSLLITTSRRSSPDATQALLNALGDTPSHVFQWGDKGDNPYMAYLAFADHIIVTGDSVSMCSEASASSNPVYIFAAKALISDKHARLHQDLFAKGYAKPLEDVKTLIPWTHAPLNAAKDMAAEVKRVLSVENS